MLSWRLMDSTHVQENSKNHLNHHKKAIDKGLFLFFMLRLIVVASGSMTHCCPLLYTIFWALRNSLKVEGWGREGKMKDLKRLFVELHWGYKNSKI